MILPPRVYLWLHFQMVRFFFGFYRYCFHRGSANTTADSHRRSIFMCYHQAWVAQTHPGRPHHDTPNITTLREKATPDQLMLLGELSKAAPSEAGRSFGGKRTPKL